MFRQREILTLSYSDTFGIGAKMNSDTSVALKYTRGLLIKWLMTLIFTINGLVKSSFEPK